MSRIERLTDAQELALIAYRDEWLAHGRSCAPADRVATEAVLRAIYAAIQQPDPYVWWCDGPAVGSLARAVVKANLRVNLWANLWDNLGDNLLVNLRANLGVNLWDNLRDNLWVNLRDNLWDNLGVNLWDNLRDNLRVNLGANLRANLRVNLWDNLRVNLGANLRANLGDNLWANLLDNLGANLGDNLGDNLWDNLWDNLGANLRDNLDWWFWGQHEAAWPAFYAWPDMALRAMHTGEQRMRLDWWLTLSRSCGWWQPFQGVVFVCERPARQAIDREGRLHHERLPALECRDGWPVYAWHGVRVPEQVITSPETLAVDQIRDEQNAEVRRVMLTRFGEERFIREIGALPIHADECGTLYRVELVNDEPLTLVRVINSTPEADGSQKPYFIRVPPDVTQARQAIAWTFGMRANDYAPAVET